MSTRILLMFIFLSPHILRATRRLPVASVYPLHYQYTFSKYLKMLDCNRRDEYSTVSIIDTSPDYCHHVSDLFFREIPQPKLIHSVYSPLITEHYIFVKNLNMTGAVLSRWISPTKVHLVVCDPYMEDVEAVRYVAARHIHDFVVVLTMDTELKVISYDPYKGEVLELAATEECPSLFPNKLANMERHVVRVAMCENLPTLKKVKGKWMGRDYDLLLLVIFALNATLDIVETPSVHDLDGIARALRGHRAEFSFEGLVQAHDFADLDSLNPNLMDGAVVLTPATPTVLVTVFSVFDAATWTALVLVAILVGALTYLAARWRLDCTAAVLVHVAATVSAIFLAVFQSTMSRTLTQAKYVEDIATIEELKGSALQVVTFPRLHRIVAGVHDLARHMTVMDKRAMYGMIEKGIGQGGRAYALPFFDAGEFLKLRRQGRPIYRQLKEMLVPSHRIFLFRKHSPYLREIKRIILQLKETGFMKELYRQTVYKEEDVESIYLTMKHLKSLFLLFCFGCCLGIASFLYEILC